MIQKRKTALESKPRRLRRKLSMLPDGYLRKLTNRRAVGNAMDRLYRELRLGLVTPAMADVLFNVLCRMLDSGLCDKDGVQTKLTGRTRSERVRPKLRDLLTRSEKSAWKKAVADAPEQILQFRADFDAGRVLPKGRPVKEHPAAKTGSFRAVAS